MRFRSFSPVLLGILTLSGIADAQRQTPVAATPLIGWNSWDSYGLTVTEEQFRANVDFVKYGLGSGKLQTRDA